MEFKLGEIERGKRERADFMTEIGHMIRLLVTSNLSPPPVSEGLGLCPRCRAPVIEGREAFGCSRWREECTFRLPKLHRSVTLTPQQVRELTTRGVVLRPMVIDGEPRILCRTATGAPFDIAPPSREAQHPAAAPRARVAGGASASRSSAPRQDRWAAAASIKTTRP